MAVQNLSLAPQNLSLAVQNLLLAECRLFGEQFNMPTVLTTADERLIANDNEIF